MRLYQFMTKIFSCLVCLQLSLGCGKIKFSPKNESQNTFSGPSFIVNGTLALIETSIHTFFPTAYAAEAPTPQNRIESEPTTLKPEDIHGVLTVVRIDKSTNGSLLEEVISYEEISNTVSFEIEVPNDGQLYQIKYLSYFDTRYDRAVIVAEDTVSSTGELNLGEINQLRSVSTNLTLATIENDNSISPDVLRLKAKNLQEQYSPEFINSMLSDLVEEEVMLGVNSNVSASIKFSVTKLSSILTNLDPKELLNLTQKYQSNHPEVKNIFDETIASCSLGRLNPIQLNLESANNVQMASNDCGFKLGLPDRQDNLPAELANFFKENQEQFVNNVGSECESALRDQEYTKYNMLVDDSNSSSISGGTRINSLPSYCMAINLSNNLSGGRILGEYSQVGVK